MSGLVLSIGELLVDFVPGEPGVTLAGAETFYKAAGGAPANVAAVVARLGGRSAFIGRVGDDPFGLWLRDTLQATGVDTRAVRLDPEAPTTLAFVSLAADADRDFAFYRNGTADTRLDNGDLDDGLLHEAAFLHFCSVSLSHEPARATTLEAARVASAAGALVSFDVNWRQPLWDDEQLARRIIRGAIDRSDILKLSTSELEFVTGSSEPGAAAELMTGRLRFIVLSRGADGVQLITQDSITGIPAFEVRPVDTTGAGDALAGALLFELARKPGLIDDSTQLLEAVRKAQAVAALSTLKPGAIPSYPDAAELQAFIDRAY